MVPILKGNKTSTDLINNKINLLQLLKTTENWNINICLFELNTV